MNEHNLIKILNLKKPLCVVDIEATGLSVSKDRIVQIAILRIDTNGDKSIFNEIINPEITISEDVIALHGITNEKASKAKTFREISEDILTFIGTADMIGYNSNKFDIPILAEELLRCNVNFNLADRLFIDVQNIFHKLEQRTLAAALQFYCEKPLDRAHDALNDVMATWEVFEAQINKYQILQKDVAFLAEFSRSHTNQMVDFAGRLGRNENGQVIYNFGKHKNKTIEEVIQIEPGYYGWMLEADFPLHTKDCLRSEMEFIKAKRKEENKDNQSLEEKLIELRNKFGQR
ncbi:MAG: exonuclease domain-containing protein [Crocinitomicaceae bacterium]